MKTFRGGGISIIRMLIDKSNFSCWALPMNFDKNIWKHQNVAAQFRQYFIMHGRFMFREQYVTSNEHLFHTHKQNLQHPTHIHRGTPSLLPMCDNDDEWVRRHQRDKMCLSIPATYSAVSLEQNIMWPVVVNPCPRAIRSSRL